MQGNHEDQAGISLDGTVVERDKAQCAIYGSDPSFEAVPSGQVPARFHAELPEGDPSVCSHRCSRRGEVNQTRLKRAARPCPADGNPIRRADQLRINCKELPLPIVSALIVVVHCQAGGQTYSKAAKPYRADSVCRRGRGNASDARIRI